MKAEELIPFKATHPGIVLKNELQAREISKKVFARDIDIQPTMLNEIIKEKRAITQKIALSLEKALDISADFWMGFQMQYDTDVVRIQERNIRKAQQKETWKLIKQFVPVSILIKRGVLSKTLNEDIATIWEIFEVNNIVELVESFSSYKNLALNGTSEKLKNKHRNEFVRSKLDMWQAKMESTY